MDTKETDNSITTPTDIKPEQTGFWIRFCAFMIDFVCVWTPCIWLIVLFEKYLSPQHILKLSGEMYFFIVLFFIFSYHTLTIGKWGQTLGTFLAGISVVTKNGKKVSYLRSFGRTLLWYFTLSVSFLGLLTIIPHVVNPGFYILEALILVCLLGAFLQNKIFFYDYICGTMVIYKKPIGLPRKIAVILFGAIVLAMLFDKTRPRPFPEKARMADAMATIDSIKSAQEKYFLKHKVYADKFTMLDIAYPKMTANKLKAKFYIVSMSTAGCGKEPCYILTATRCSSKSTVASRYGLYSLNTIIPNRPQVQIASCPGGGSNCDELIN